MKKNVKIFLTSVLYLFLTTSLSFSQTQSLNISQKLTTHTADDFQPDVSPDGKSVAFVSNRSGNNDIWLIPIDGGPARQLTTHTASDSDPAWSRDGKKIAFTSLREDSKGDIWVLDLDRNKETRGDRGYPWVSLAGIKDKLPPQLHRHTSWQWSDCLHHPEQLPIF